MNTASVRGALTLILILILGSAVLISGGCGRDFTLPIGGKDSTPPGFSGVSLVPAHATVGTEVVLEFDATEVLPTEVKTGEESVPNPQVSVDGHPFTCSVEDLHYRCILQTVREMREGEFEVMLSALDGAGNRSVPLSDPPILRLDFTPPLLTVTATPPQVEPGQVLAIAIRAGEALSAPPAITSDFFAPLVCEDATGVGRLFACTTLLDSGLDANGDPQIIEARSGDLAGNQAQGQTTVILASPSPRLDPGSVQVSPQVATDGQSVSIQFRSEGSRLDRCGVLIGTRVANCLNKNVDNGNEPAFTECTCAFDVVPQVLEGLQTVILSGTNRRGTTELQTSFNVDRTAPRIDGSKIHFLRRAAGTDDAIWAEAGAAVDDLGIAYTDPAPSVTWLHIYDGPEASATWLNRFRPAGDGSLADVSAPISLGDHEAASIWVEPEDIAGNRGPRVIAGKVEATLTFDGRTPYDPAVSPLSVYAFTTDLDPTALPPGFGAARGEAGVNAIAEVTSEDGAVLETVAAAPGWGSSSGIAPQYRVRAFDRVGRTKASSYRNPVTGAFEMRGGQTDICSGGSSWSAGGQRFLGSGFEPSPGLGQSFYFPYGDFDSLRGLGIWIDSNGNVAECDASRCRQVVPASRPTLASMAGARYFTGLGKLIRFGGFEAPGGVYSWYNETWAYDPVAVGGATWTPISTSNRPGPRAAFSMSADSGSLDAAGASIAARLYVYGGWVTQWPNEQRYADLWAFDGSNWSQLSSGGAAGARSHAVMVRDTLNNRLLVSGGLRWVGTTAQGYPDMRIDNDVQAYDLASGTWSTLRPVTINGCSWNPPDPGPCDYASTGIWDPVGARLLVYAKGEVWAFQEDPGAGAGSWKNLSPRREPEARYLGALIDLPGAGRLAQVGGFTETGLVSSGLSLWDGRWYALAVDPLRSDLPPVVAVRVPARAASMLFIDQTTWTLSEVQGDSARIEAGSLALPSSGIKGAAFDTTRQEAILLDGSIPPRTYAFDGVRLRQLSVSSPPPFRDRFDLVYDAARREVLFFGGRTFNGTLTDELWAFDGKGWSLRQPADSVFPQNWNCGGSGGWPPPPPLPSRRPVARAEATLTYDAVSGRVLLFGGEDVAGATLDDLWSYDGVGWQMLAMPQCRWSGGVSLPQGCSAGLSDYAKVVGARAGASATFAASEGAVAFFGGRLGAVPIVDEGFMLTALSIPGTGRMPSHLYRLRLEDGASLSALVIHHRGSALSPQLLNTPEPGLRLHVWVETEDVSSGEALGWVEVSPSGAGETNEVLDVDVGARFDDPAFVPTGLGVADMIVGGQVWILVTPRQASRRISGVGADGHAELSSDRFWIDATYAF